MQLQIDKICIPSNDSTFIHKNKFHMFYILHGIKWLSLILSRNSYFLRFRKFDTSSICGIQLGPVPHSCIIFSNLTRCILHALPGKSSKTFSQTAPHVAVSSFVYSIYGMGSPLKKQKEKNQVELVFVCILRVKDYKFN